MRYESKYFNEIEYRSPDDRTSGHKISDRLLIALDYVREQLETPLILNSAYRSEAHNIKVGGVPGSQHRFGRAADIRIDSQEMGDQIEYHFKEFTHNICGIGRYNTFIHVDVRDVAAYWDNR